MQSRLPTYLPTYLASPRSYDSSVGKILDWKEGKKKKLTLVEQIDGYAHLYMYATVGYCLRYHR